MRLLLVAAVALLYAPRLEAQAGPPVFAGAAFSVGSVPYLFRPDCDDVQGKRVFGPELWAGLHFGGAKVVLRGAFLSDPRRGDPQACSAPIQNGTYERHQYANIGDDGTMLDIRAIYGHNIIGKLNVAAGAHAGKINERKSKYYGWNAAVRFGSVGVGYDYSVHSVDYRTVTEVYKNGNITSQQDLGAQIHSVPGWTVKIFAEMTH